MIKSTWGKREGFFIYTPFSYHMKTRLKPPLQGYSGLTCYNN